MIGFIDLVKWCVSQGFLRYTNKITVFLYQNDLRPIFTQLDIRVGLQTLGMYFKGLHAHFRETDGIIMLTFILRY